MKKKTTTVFVALVLLSSIFLTVAPAMAESEERNLNLNATIPEDDDTLLEAIRKVMEEKGFNWTAAETWVSKLSPEEQSKLCGTMTEDEKLEEDDELEAIQKAIGEEGYHWTAAETWVSELSDEDQEKLCGTLPDEGTEKGPKIHARIEDKIVGLPTNFDWRNYGGDWTTPIVQQSCDYRTLTYHPCGSCWAFGITAALESCIKRAGDNPNLPVDLSEQFALSCSAGDCSGWYASDALNFLSGTGTVDEDCFLYTSYDTTPCTDRCPDWQSRGTRVCDWGWVSGQWYDSTVNMEDLIKAYLYDFGPLPTYMKVYADFQYYGGGIYQYTTGAYKGGHEVTLVGWGSDGYDDYWIVKNSWGGCWGEDENFNPYDPYNCLWYDDGPDSGGWFRILRGNNECQIEAGTNWLLCPRDCGRVLFYEGHNPASGFSLANRYAEWGYHLAANGYVIDSSTATPLTMNLLKYYNPTTGGYEPYDMVIIAEPTTSFSTSELSVLREYVGTGRVAAIGDGNVFDKSNFGVSSGIPYYDHDNEVKSISLTNWLTNAEGGGLLIMGEWGGFATAAGVFGPSNQVANLFDMAFKDNTVYDPTRNVDWVSYWPILGPHNDVALFCGCEVTGGTPIARASSAGYTGIAKLIGEPRSYQSGELPTGELPSEPPVGTIQFTGPVMIAGVEMGVKEDDDIGVWRSGKWYLDYNGNGYWDAGDKLYWFGVSTDTPVTGDWNGDGRDEIGLWRSGKWYLDYNGNGYWDASDKIYTFGGSTDTPVTGDWNGDGRDEIGLWRSGKWYLDYNGNGYWDAGDKLYWFGVSTDTPVTGDWNCDGRDEIGVWRSGKWYLDYNGNGYWDAGDKLYWFGVSTDTPVTGDWNGDGRDEIGLWRSGKWYLDYNGNGYWDAGDKLYWFGVSTDTPVTGDWNGGA